MSLFAHGFLGGIPLVGAMITLQTLPILQEHADIHGNVLRSRENMRELFTLARAALIAEPQLRAMVGANQAEIEFGRWASVMLEEFPKPRYLKKPPAPGSNRQLVELTEG